MNISEVKFETFKPSPSFSINKEGVRAIHISSGMIAESIVEKSHFFNKRKALHLLKEKIMSKQFKVSVNLLTENSNSHSLNLYLNKTSDFIKTLIDHVNFNLSTVYDYYIECNDLNIQAEISKMMRDHLDEIEKDKTNG